MRKGRLHVLEQLLSLRVIHGLDVVVIKKVLLLRHVVVVLEPVPVQGVLVLVSRDVGDVDRVGGYGPLIGFRAVSLWDSVNLFIMKN